VEHSQGSHDGFPPSSKKGEHHVSVTADRLRERPITIQENWQTPFDTRLTGDGVSIVGNFVVGSLTNDEPGPGFRIAMQHGTGSFLPATLDEPCGFLTEFLAHDWGLDEFQEDWDNTTVMTMQPSYSFTVFFDAQRVSYGMPSPFGIEED
jgi:hypothetical protein